MPPAKLLTRSVHDHVDYESRRENIKPYTFKQRPSKEIQRKEDNAKDDSKTDESCNSSINNEYMHLDEFIESSRNSDPSDYSNESDDYPRPNVDLLASLLTLGRMIASQKRIIKNQNECLNQTNTIFSYNPKSLIQTNEINTAVIQNPNKHQLVNVVSATTYPIMSSKRDSVPTTDSGIHDDLSPLSTDSQTTSKSYSSSKSDTSDSPTHSAFFKIPIPDGIRDNEYWEHRRKNNIAARKSREERRKKELETLEVSSKLEQENKKLTKMLNRLTKRNEVLEYCVQIFHKEGVLSTTTSTDES